MLPDKMFGFLCSLNIFNCELACSILLIGLIISSSVIFGWLGAYNINFHGVDRLRSKCFEWVFKVLSIYNQVKGWWDRGSPFFFLARYNLLFYFLRVGFLLDIKIRGKKNSSKDFLGLYRIYYQLFTRKYSFNLCCLKSVFWFLKWTKYEWIEVFTNCFYIIFEIRKWCRHNLYFSLLSSLILISTSFFFLQQPILNFNLCENFYKPLRNMYDMSGRTDSVVLCDRVIEFSSQLRETKIIPSLFFHQDSPSPCSSLGGSANCHCTYIIHCICY